MKTIKKIILAISAAAFALPALSACDDEFEYTFIDPIEYTAVAPVVEYINVSFESYWTEDRDKVYVSDDRNAEFITDELDELVDYLREDNDVDKTFLLKYGLKSHPLFYERNNYIAYMKDQLHTVVKFAAYVEELGSQPDPPGVASGIAYSFTAVCVIRPFKTEYTGDEFYYEFGNNHDGFYNKYVNIYCGEECFATFYYDPWVPISQEWFENYLNENLIWEDAYENQ